MSVINTLAPERQASNGMPLRLVADERRITLLVVGELAERAVANYLAHEPMIDTQSAPSITDAQWPVQQGPCDAILVGVTQSDPDSLDRLYQHAVRPVLAIIDDSSDGVGHLERGAFQVMPQSDVDKGSLMLAIASAMLHRRHLESLDGLLESHPDGILALTAANTVCFMNSAARKLMGEAVGLEARECFGQPVTGEHGIVKVVRPMRSRAQEMEVEYRVVDGVWEGKPARYVFLRHVDKLMNELRLLESLGLMEQAPVTARAFDAAPIRDSVPTHFATLCESYKALLGAMLDRRMFGDEVDLTEPVTALASQLGALRASPRDLIDLHIYATRECTTNSEPQRSEAFFAEGRLLCLDLMGKLVSFYRSRAVRSRRDVRPTSRQETNDG